MVDIIKEYFRLQTKLAYSDSLIVGYANLKIREHFLQYDAMTAFMPAILCLIRPALD